MTWNRFEHNLIRLESRPTATSDHRKSFFELDEEIARRKVSCHRVVPSQHPALVHATLSWRSCAWRDGRLAERLRRKAFYARKIVVELALLG